MNNIKKTSFPEKAVHFLKNNISKIISFGWTFSIIISFFMFLLGIAAFSYGFYEIWDFFKHGRIPKDTLFLIISLLKDFLLAFVLVLLSVGIYDKIKNSQETGSTKVELIDIEINFIGIVILTMLVVVLGLILPQMKNTENMDFLLKPENILSLSISIAILIAAASMYIKCITKEEKANSEQTKSPAPK